LIGWRQIYYLDNDIYLGTKIAITSTWEPEDFARRGGDLAPLV
jgi:hypothetical protein